MADTVIHSLTKSVVISPDTPFTIIGERINPTGRNKLAAEMASGDYSRVIKDAVDQVEAGAHILDVNAGIPLTDEPALLSEIVQIVQSTTEVPLCIDSSIPDALKRGLEVYKGKALVNSVTGEEERLETILPYVKKYNAAVIGISNDETGISEDPTERFNVARKILERALDYSIPREDILIDPLVMPIGAMRYAGRQIFSIIRRVQEELGCNTICGASNISFGLPNRVSLNANFVPMAIASGLTAAITNPLESSIKQAIAASDVLMGNDENCLRWIRENKGQNTPAQQSVNDHKRRKRERRFKR